MSAGSLLYLRKSGPSDSPRPDAVTAHSGCEAPSFTLCFPQISSILPAQSELFFLNSFVEFPHRNRRRNRLQSPKYGLLRSPFACRATNVCHSLSSEGFYRCDFVRESKIARVDFPPRCSRVFWRFSPLHAERFFTRSGEDFTPAGWTLQLWHSMPSDCCCSLCLACLHSPSIFQREPFTS